MLFPIESMWCCLSPVEREVALFVRIAIQVPPFYLTVDDFNTVWALNDPENNTERRARFTETYDLDTTMVEVAPDVFVPAYVIGGPFWGLLNVFEVTHGFTCAEPCSYLTFPPVA